MKFNRSEEARWGADWLWWFVSADGRCFGLLIQAKTLRGTPGARHIKFEQANQQGRQDEALWRTADALEIPAAYVIYFGPPAYRPDLARGEGQTAWSASNDDMAVGMLDLLVYSKHVASLADDEFAAAWGRMLTSDEARRAPLRAGRNRAAEDAFAWSRPLVRLADGASERLWPRLAFMYPKYQEVWNDLAARTGGPATVAKAIMDYLSTVREGQASMITASAPVFTDLPEDRGHFGRPYIPYILRGYRDQPPAYVRDVLDGRELSQLLPTSVKGVVVVAE